MITKTRPLQTLAIGFAGCLAFTACIFDSEASNPFQGLSCQDKMDKMAREINAFAKSHPPVAKIAVNESGKADSARLPIPIFRGYPPEVQADSTSQPPLYGDPPLTQANPDSVAFRAYCQRRDREDGKLTGHRVYSLG